MQQASINILNYINQFNIIYYAYDLKLMSSQFGPDIFLTYKLSIVLLNLSSQHFNIHVSPFNSILPYILFSYLCTMLFLCFTHRAKHRSYSSFLKNWLATPHFNKRSTY